MNVLKNGKASSFISFKALENLLSQSFLFPIMVTMLTENVYNIYKLKDII